MAGMNMDPIQMQNMYMNGGFQGMGMNGMGGFGGHAMCVIGYDDDLQGGAIVPIAGMN